MPSGPDQSAALCAALGDALRQRGLLAVTAESCTGGGIAAACTAIDGASEWLYGGFVTYSNGAKQRLLKVPVGLLDHHGAVSEPVARAMAEGALGASGADLALAVTGIAGPGGGEVLTPVGTVWFGFALRGVGTETAVQRFSGDRARVRSEAVLFALEGALALLASDTP